MLEFFRRLLSGGQATATPVARKTASASNGDAFSHLNEQVPLQSATDKQKAFVRREAILDRSEKIVAYEFSLLMTLQERLLRRGGMAKQAYDAALLTRLTVHKVHALLGHRLAFINVSPATLASPLVDALPPHNTVLMLDVAQPPSDWAGLAARLAELKAKGFLCGLSIHEAGLASNPLVDGMDYVQIDTPAFNGIDLRTLSRTLRGEHREGKHVLRLVARNVQSHDDFQFCKKCGFDYFQGPFISSRESLQPINDGVNRMAMLSILNMVRSDASFERIAASLKHEPTLTYKLLRYLNSPAMALPQPTDNLTQALQFVGRDKFYRWTSLLLFEFGSPSYREHALTERALTRGRTLELLAGKGSIPNASEHLFLVGLFSLLDQALGRPLPELLAQATLPDSVRDALLGKPGAYTDALALATLGEADAATHAEPMDEALQHCGIDDTAFTLASAAALVWTHEVLGETQ